MPLPVDCHMHTPLCRHAVGEPVDYAKRVVETGLTEIIEESVLAIDTNSQRLISS
jgi:hypothetical protein